MLVNLIGKRRLSFLIAFSLFAWADVASAQTIPQSLDVVIEALDDEAQMCNFTRAGLNGAAQAALRYSRITLNEEAEAYLYVSATVMQLDSGCIANLLVSVRQWDTLPDALGGHIRGIFQYCSSNYIMSGAQDSSRVYATLRDGVEQCLSEIKAAESPSVDRSFRDILNKAKRDE